MADPYTATVCGTCGGSGEIAGQGYYAGSDNMDFEVGEPESCDNCAGSGWEPPEDVEGEDDEEDNGSASCPLALPDVAVSE